MPFFFDRAHYQAIAHLLVAGDIQARVVSNQKAMSVEVKLQGGSIVLWNNGDTKGWTWTRVDDKGELEFSQETLAPDAPPDDVAHFIAVYPYAAKPERVSSL